MKTCTRCEKADCKRLYSKLCSNCYMKFIYKPKNNDKILAAKKRYRDKNKEKLNNYIKDRKLKNRSLYNYYESCRRARKLQASPVWSDKIKVKEFYSNCLEGFEVDHIIPLQGKNVCGLHVEYNLQYLSSKDNRIKGNKL